MFSPSQRAYESVPLRGIALADEHGDPYAEILGTGVPLYNHGAIEDDLASCKLDADVSSAPIKSAGDTEDSAVSCRRNGPRHSFRTPRGRPSSNELWRFRVRGCQDCWAALFFIALVTAVLLWGAAQIWQLELSEYDLAVIAGEVELGSPMQSESQRLPPTKRETLRRTEALQAGVAALWKRHNAVLSPNQAHTRIRPHLSIGSVMGTLILFAVAVTTTLLVAYGGLLIISLYPRRLIFLQSSACSMFFAVSAGTALANGALLGALMLAILSVMPWLWVYFIQDRIPFTAAMLAATVAVLRQHKSLFVISFCSALVSWLALAAFALCVMPSVLRLASGWGGGSDTAYPFFALFSLFWVQEVMSALVHVTVCGVMATWYFAGEGHMPDFPVKRSFQRAATTTLGSVCFGSLVTAIVSLLHFLVDCLRSGSDENGFWACLMDCLVGCIEDLVRYFNNYAFVHVAIYGCSYMDAARETWELVGQCAFSAIFNDSLVSQVVVMMTLISAALVAVVTGIVTWSAPAATVMFAMTWVVCSIFYSPITSCVTTLFVCFAEVPVGLQLSFPELYDALVDADAGYTMRRGGAPNVYGACV
ncbi:hypothetical protein ABL78_6420 [Leptomonas seymouri]|uniref:Choline transporter-like protein n=1 Tax=Leptomonas seymouri TaxID=5684 RepID=A0A0N1PA24_LEPSE|nr:hypothetical protein ABL78_6420 [Leptomonas seymouri]|eukprot:KPI84535.1 hypothetical protein ABL78_6420 [Leptomonas seymouri]